MPLSPLYLQMPAWKQSCIGAAQLPAKQRARFVPGAVQSVILHAYRDEEGPDSVKSGQRLTTGRAWSCIRWPQLWFQAALLMIHHHQIEAGGSMPMTTRLLWRNPEAKLPVSLHHTATLFSALQRLISSTQGEHTCLVQ